MLSNTTQKFIRYLSTASATAAAARPTKPATSITWRNQLHDRQLIYQISSILLQRRDWLPLLHPFNLSRTLNPPLFLHILNNIQSNPQISLSFFKWAKYNLGFQPDLKAHVKIVQILIKSGNTKPVKPLLDSIVRDNAPAAVIDSLIQACGGSDSKPVAFELILDYFTKSGLYLESIEVYSKSIVHGYVPKIGCCNALLGALEHASELKLSWCLYGSMIRNGIVGNATSWSIIARILCKYGKLERVERLLNITKCNSVIYSLVIEYYSKNGNLGAALDCLNEVCDKKLEPGFASYVSILDGACESGDVKVVDDILSEMVDKKLISISVVSDYDDVIKKFCDLGKTYAAELLFKRAQDKKVHLGESTFGSMLAAYSEKGRVKEAIKMYHLIVAKGIMVFPATYQMFVDMICLNGNSTEDVLQILIEIMKQRVTPGTSELSKFVVMLRRQDRWKDVEDLVNAILEQGLIPNASICGSLLKFYSSCGHIDSAIEFQGKLVKLDVVLDVKNYNDLLRCLFAEKRTEEASELFEWMKMKNAVSCASFLVMISGLSSKKDMRKAMKVHDEMLKMGLKPGAKTYKSLISVFK